MLVNDTEYFAQTRVGSWIREAGKRDEARLKNFLNKHDVTMPRVILRIAIDKLDPELRRHYLDLAKHQFTILNLTLLMELN